jgi:hypothetical protein
MRQIRETLRLHLQSAVSYDEVGRAFKISKSVAGKYVSLAGVAGVDWAIAQTLTDAELEAWLYWPAVPRSSFQLTLARCQGTPTRRRHCIDVNGATLRGKKWKRYRLITLCCKGLLWGNNCRSNFVEVALIEDDRRA